MGNLQGFNANDHDPNFEFKTLPQGDYLAIIKDSQEKPNKKGTGSYIELTFQVIDGEHKDSTIKTYLNLNNPSQTAVRIAQAELSAICHAVNKLTPSDTTELHNLPLVIYLVCKKKKSQTGEDVMRNEIKAYKSKKQAFEAQAQSQAPVAGPGSQAPWTA